MLTCRLQHSRNVTFLDLWCPICCYEPNMKIKEMEKVLLCVQEQQL